MISLALKGHPNQDTSSTALYPTVNKWDLMKLRSFCMAKGSIIWAKQQPTEWEKSFSNYMSDREMVSKMYEELKNLNIKNTNNPIKNGESSQKT